MHAVLDWNDHCLGYYRPLTAADIESEPTLLSLSQWRNQHRNSFLNTGLSTPDSTRSYLAKILQDAHRRLYLLFNEQQELVGQYGLRNISSVSIELDGGIKGSTPTNSRFFYHVQRAMLTHCFQDLAAQKVCARVLEDNLGARFLHHQLGLRETSRIPTEDGRVLVMLEITESYFEDWNQERIIKSREKKMNVPEEFQKQVARNLAGLASRSDLKQEILEWALKVARYNYSYNFTWMGRPIIQYPQDMVAMQELIWSIKPDLIIETGIAHGGSLILSASMLALLEYCDAVEQGQMLDPSQPKRQVIGLDIDIRAHNRAAIEAHPLAPRIQMLQGSSIDPAIIAQVRDIAADHERILVCLDSNHTHDHVLAELHAYAPLVTPGSYCVVFDTVIENMPAEMFPDRPWGPGNNPKTAVWEYLKSHPEFEIDRDIQHKLLITVAPDGYLRRVSYE